MIKIVMYQKKWQIHIDNEKWEFENLQNFLSELRLICVLKDRYGKEVLK
jgi:hypothetical protein